MQTYKERMILEQEELNGRINRLSQFQRTGTYAALEHIDRLLLTEQYWAMLSYSRILGMRIGRADK